MRLTDEIRADVAAATRERERAARAPLSLIAASLFRLGSLAKRHGHHWTATVTQGVCQFLTGADIDMSASIGPGLFIQHTVGVVIGPGVRAGSRLTLYGATVLGGRWKSHRGWGYPVLGDDVVLFAKASVLGPVTVGDAVQVGAHSLLLDDAPSGSRVRSATGAEVRPPATE